MKPSSPVTLLLAAVLVVGVAPVLGIAVVGAAVLPSTAQSCEDASQVATSSGAWRAPLRGGYVVTSEFGRRYHPVLHVTKLHTGIDLVATDDRTVLAAAAGRVVEQRYDAAYGNEVVIDHGGSIRTRYAHMAAASTVRHGQKVDVGRRLGRIGATGYVTGAHLHFEVIGNGTPIDPKPFMASHGAALDGRSRTLSQPGRPSEARRAADGLQRVSVRRVVGTGRGGVRIVIDGERLRNARVISSAGRKVGAGNRAVVIALMTALQESGLRNLDYGDRDSLGLFQQRPSAGWGSASQVRDVDYSSRAFFGGPKGPNDGEPAGLLDTSGWKTMRLGDAAQAVQRSAFPGAYDQWAQLARQINRAVGGGGVEGERCMTSSPTGDATAGRAGRDLMTVSATTAASPRQSRRSHRAG